MNDVESTGYKRIWQGFVYVSILGMPLGLFFMYRAAKALYRQVGEIGRARQLQSLLALIRYIDDPKLSKTRWLMHEYVEQINKLLEDNPDISPLELDEVIKRLTHDGLTVTDINFTIAAFNNVSYLIRARHADENFAFAFEHLFLRVDRIFGSYIKYRRSNSGKDGYHNNYAQQLLLLVDELKSRAGSNEPA